MIRFSVKAGACALIFAFIVSHLPALANDYTPPDNGHPQDSRGSGTR